jgi:hypothetical protein
MAARNQPYTLIRTVGENLLACGDFRDLNASFVAAKGSSSTDDYVPVEIEVVRNWSEYREGGDPIGHIVIQGGEPAIETWILNVAAVVTLAPSHVRHAG